MDFRGRTETVIQDLMIKNAISSIKALSLLPSPVIFSDPLRSQWKDYFHPCNPRSKRVWRHPNSRLRN